MPRLPVLTDPGAADPLSGPPKAHSVHDAEVVLVTERNRTRVLDVRDYGVVGDGVTDDSAAWQAIHDAEIPSASAGGGGVILVPPHFHSYIGTGLVFTKPNITILGSEGTGFGSATDSFEAASCELVSDQPIHILTIGSDSATDWRGARVEDLVFRDSSASNNQVLSGIYQRRSNAGVYRNVKGRNITAGALIRQAGDGSNPQYNAFYDLGTRGCKFGILQETFCPDTRVFGGEFFCSVPGSNTPIAGSRGIVSEGGTRAVGSAFQGVEIGALLRGPRDNFIACRFENANGFPGEIGVLVSADGSFATAGRSNAVTDCIFTLGRFSDIPIRVAAGAVKTVITDPLTDGSGFQIEDVIDDQGADTVIRSAVDSYERREHWRTLENNSATPSVPNHKYWTADNSSATTITNLLTPALTGPGVPVVERVILAINGNTTIAHGTNIKLAGGNNFAMTAQDTLTLVRRGAAWREVARSVNSN